MKIDNLSNWKTEEESEEMRRNRLGQPTEERAPYLDGNFCDRSVMGSKPKVSTFLYQNLNLNLKPKPSAFEFRKTFSFENQKPKKDHLKNLKLF